MASLVGAVYKGAANLAQAGAGATYSKLASQIPSPSRAIYNLGLGIGPILESIVSEYAKKDKSDTKQSPDQNIAKATAQGFNVLANQISFLSTIMKDIRNIALLQFKEQKAASFKERALEVQKRFGEQEAIIEQATKASLSSIMSSKAKEGDKQQDFFKNLDLLKFGLGAALTAFMVDTFLPKTSETLQKVFKESLNDLSSKLEESLKTGILKPLKELPLVGHVLKLSEYIGELNTQLKGALGERGASSLTSGVGAGLFTTWLLSTFTKSKRPGLMGLGAGLSVAGLELFQNAEPSLAEQGAASLAGAGAAAATGAAAGYLLKGRNGSPEAPTATQKESGGSRDASKAQRQARARRRIKSKSSLITKAFNKLGSARVINFISSKLGITSSSLMAGANRVLPIIARISPVTIIISIALFLIDYFSEDIEDLLISAIDELEDFMNERSAEGQAKISSVDEGSQPFNPTEIALIPPVAKPGISDTVTVPPRDAAFNMEQYMQTVKSRESGGNPNAKNPFSSATGLYQFTRGTYEGDDKNPGVRYQDPRLKGLTFDQFVKDANAQEIGMRILTKMNYDVLKGRLGRAPTDDELYLAHFLGASRAAALIEASEQNKLAKDVLPESYFEANSRMLPNMNESAATVMERIKGYYKTGSYAFKPGTNFDPSKMNNQTSQGLDISKQSEGQNFAQQIASMMKNYTELMTGTFLANQNTSNLSALEGASSGSGNTPLSPNPTSTPESQRIRESLSQYSPY